LVDLLAGSQVNDLIADDASLPSNRLDDYKTQSNMPVNSRNKEVIKKRYPKKRVRTLDYLLL